MKNNNFRKMRVWLLFVLLVPLLACRASAGIDIDEPGDNDLQKPVSSSYNQK